MDNPSGKLMPISGLIFGGMKGLYSPLNSLSNSFYFILFSFLSFKSLVGSLCLQLTLDISEFNIHSFNIFPETEQLSLWLYIILISPTESRKCKNLENKPG